MKEEEGKGKGRGSGGWKKRRMNEVGGIKWKLEEESEIYQSHKFIHVYM